MHLARHNTPNIHMYTNLHEPTSTSHSTICLQFIALHTARLISKPMGVIHPQGMCTHLSKNTQAYEDELLVQAAILYCKFIKLRTYKQWQWEIRTWHSCMLISHAQRTHGHTIDASPTHTYKVCTQLHASVPFDEPRLIHINYWPTMSMSRSGAEAFFSCYWEKTSAAERFRWSTNAHCTYLRMYACTLRFSQDICPIYLNMYSMYVHTSPFFSRAAPVQSCISWPYWSQISQGRFWMSLNSSLRIVK